MFHRSRKSFGGHSERETPGPIPNPEAKPLSVDGTARGTLWESRSPPDIIYKKRQLSTYVGNGAFFMPFSTPPKHAQTRDWVRVDLAQGHDTSSMKSNPPPHDGVNEVHLVGCVSSLPTTKVLPSGDEVVEFRIVIDRRRRRGAKREVDSLELAAWNPREKRQALKLTPGQWVEIDGSVHRRFWSSPKGLASRWQIEVSLLRRM